MRGLQHGCSLIGDQMKQTTAALILSACAIGANAADIDFTGTAGAACGFTNIVPGTLNVVGSSFTTATSATYDITNNDPAGFVITVPQVTAFQAAPGSAALSGDLVQIPSIASGANSGSSFSGSDSAGYTVTLANVGTDSLTHSVSGTITNEESGAYTVRVPVTCTAL